jgi:ribosomal protein S17
MPNKKEPEVIKKEKVQKMAKKIFGIATRNSLDKTVPVEVTYTKTHRLYGKRFKVSRKILAHTEADVVRGQKVTIVESRQRSKNKSWIVQA